MASIAALFGGKAAADGEASLEQIRLANDRARDAERDASAKTSHRLPTWMLGGGGHVSSDKDERTVPALLATSDRAPAVQEMTQVSPPPVSSGAVRLEAGLEATLPGESTTRTATVSPKKAPEQEKQPLSWDSESSSGSPEPSDALETPCDDPCPKSSKGHLATAVGSGGRGWSGMDIAALVKFQCMVRMWLVRKEVRRGRSDHKLEIRRKTLIFHLHMLGASRRANTSLIGYLAIMATFLTLVLGGFNSAKQYEVAGNVSDLVMGNYHTESVTGWDVASRMDIYAFLKNSVVGGMSKKSSMRDNVILYNEETLVQEFVVVLRRGKMVDCSTLYPIYNKDFMNHNDGWCATNTLDTDTFDLDDKGGESDWVEWGQDYHRTGDDCVEGELTEEDCYDEDYYRAGEKCPPLKYHKDWSVNEGHAIVLSMLNSIDDMKQVLTLMEACDVIDERTRRVTVELLWTAGNEYPYIGLMMVHFDISLGGQITTSMSVVTVTGVDAKYDKHRKIERQCQVVLVALSIAGLSIAALEFLGNAAYYQLLYLMKAFRDVWQYMNILCYILLIIQAQKYFALEKATDNMLASETYNVYFKELAKIQDVKHEYRIFNSMAALLLFIKFFFFFRFRGMLSMLTKALYHVTVPLGHFLFSMGVVYCGFAVAGNSLFGGMVRRFSTFLLSIETLLNMTFGDFDYTELKRVNQTSAFLYFYGFMTLVVLILLNFFIAIIMEGYAVVFTRGDVNVPVWQAAWQDLHAARQNFKGRVLTADELAWILRFDPTLKHRNLVTLFHIRTISPVPLSAETSRCIFDYLVSSGVEPDDAMAAYDNHYKYIAYRDYVNTVKRRYEPWCMPCRPCRNYIGIAVMHMTSFFISGFMERRARKQHRRAKKSRRTRERKELATVLRNEEAQEAQLSLDKAGIIDGHPVGIRRRVESQSLYASPASVGADK